MNELDIEKIFGEPIVVLYHLYDHKEKEIHKRDLKYEVLSNYNRLMNILDTLKTEELIDIHDDGKRHIVSITPKGCKLVEKLREISHSL
ncbi:hypothetical protein A3207_00665 [Candidatus Methanomassiliicoccus intestinalis]|uniref:ArnR1-like winged helix-turn-helix domain-containing protein n=2 Tax=Candidatus Methanomassiliicoccus intestinalis TaxID=1406512 RepID=R9T6J3_METII|nr:hypothetical protein [Candidatus Methanomassiliicoccus intestinalis]AGN26340.1 hypothetical protein MMINT_09930 [Candidatus Methanomassiliicoccus intestinalis Issoire-Mx1]TQS84588.1 MAG: hypothetical protein A3207_00665 [Candidatus Methanomassiliicoccus intestinalis]